MAVVRTPLRTTTFDQKIWVSMATMKMGAMIRLLWASEMRRTYLAKKGITWGTSTMTEFTNRLNMTNVRNDLFASVFLMAGPSGRGSPGACIFSFEPNSEMKMEMAVIAPKMIPMPLHPSFATINGVAARPAIAPRIPIAWRQALTVLRSLVLENVSGYRDVQLMMTMV